MGLGAAAVPSVWVVAGAAVAADGAGWVVGAAGGRVGPVCVGLCVYVFACVCAYESPSQKLPAITGLYS